MRILRLVVFAVAISISFTLATNGQQSTHTPVLDITAIDRSIDPCVDFFAYACGGWIKNNPIPADQSSWDLYSKLPRHLTLAATR